MSSDVDAVIAALRIVLKEVERQTWASSFEIHIVNKWIGQLPGAWTGRWRRLRLTPTVYEGGTAYREAVLTHLRATLAYLEVNRDVIKTRRSWSWPLRTRKPEPIDADFKEIAEPTEKPMKKPGKSVRLIKGGEYANRRRIYQGARAGANVEFQAIRRPRGWQAFRILSLPRR